MNDRLKLMLDYARDFEMTLRSQRERVVEMMGIPVTWLLSAMSFLIGATVTAPDLYAAYPRLLFGLPIFVIVGLLIAYSINRGAGRVADFNKDIADRIANLRRLTIETEDEIKFRELFNLLLRKYDEGYNRMWRGWIKKPVRQPKGLEGTERFIREGE